MKKNGTHPNNEDIAQKAFTMQFSEGTIPLEGLEFDTLPVKEVLSTGIQNIETTDDEADCLFRLVDGSLLHIEFQSTYDKWDVVRFAQYHLHFYNTHKKELEKLDLKEKIKTVVIYTKKVEGSSINKTIDTGSLNFNMETIFVKSLPGDEIFDKIKKKIEKNPNVSLSTKEEQQLIYNPYMTQRSSIAERTVEIATLLSTLKNDETKFRLVGTLATLTKKHLDKDSLNKIWEVFKMGAVFDKFQEQEREEMIQLGMMIVGMYSLGKSTEEIAKQTNLPKQKVEKFIEQFTKKFKK